jgi:hypothetical protein
VVPGDGHVSTRVSSSVRALTHAKVAVVLVEGDEIHGRHVCFRGGIASLDML